MFADTDMTKLRDAVKDFRKLSFMGDLNFLLLEKDEKQDMAGIHTLMELFGRLKFIPEILSKKSMLK